MKNYRTVIDALKIVDPTQPYGTELFDALARLTISVAVEAVCLRLNPTTQKIEVYLVQRSPNDTAYPNEWHCPGTVMRPTEEIEDTFRRLSRKEFGAGFLKKQFIANANHPTEVRGHFFSLVYICVLEEKGSLRGRWFPVSELPEKTVEHHIRRIIPAAVGAFVAESTSVCR